MKTLHIGLVLILLAASPATAVCELACAHAEPTATEHHGDDCSDSSPAKHGEGCCCISQRLAMREASDRTVLQDTAGVATTPSISVVAAGETPRPANAEDPLTARPPFTDRNRPLLI